MEHKREETILKKLFFCLKCISTNRCVCAGCCVACEHAIDGTMGDQRILGKAETNLHVKCTQEWSGDMLLTAIS